MSGLAPRTVQSSQPLRTPQDYLAIASLADPQGRLAILNRDGFRTGVQVEYASGDQSYGVIVLRFRDQPSALDYLRAHIRDVCSISSGLEALQGLAGVVYLRDDGLARAVFVIGDAEISLCNCVGIGGDQKKSVAADWAHAIAQQLE